MDKYCGIAALMVLQIAGCGRQKLMEELPVPEELLGRWSNVNPLTEGIVYLDVTPTTIDAFYRVGVDGDTVSESYPLYATYRVQVAEQNLRAVTEAAHGLMAKRLQPGREEILTVIVGDDGSMSTTLWDRRGAPYSYTIREEFYK